MPRMHVVFGAYEGPIDAKPGEKVVFIGDCASWEGQLGDKLVQIESLYQDRSTKDPYEAKHDDIYAKMASVTREARRAPERPAHPPRGLPGERRRAGARARVAGQARRTRTSRPTEVGALQQGLPRLARRRRAAKRLGGTPYQVHGPCRRGDAAPEVK